MIRRINFLIFALLLIAVVSFVFLFNQSPITVAYGPKKSFTAATAVVLVVTFLLGLLFSACIAFFFGIKLRLQQRKLLKELRAKDEHLRLIEQARGELALGDFSAAESLLTKIISRDPNNIVAIVQAAEVRRKQNDIAGALNILDQARIDQRKNAELLLMAAELNAAMGNHTAAYDNSALVLKIKPKNRYALEQLTRSCLALDKLSEAIAYQQELVRLLSGEEHQSALERLAELELRKAVRNSEGNVETLHSSIQQLLRNHKEYPPALNLLAEAEYRQGKIESANKLSRRVFQLTGDPKQLQQIASSWLKLEQPTRAVSEIRAAIASASTIPEANKYQSRLFLTRLLLSLEMVDEAREEFHAIENIVSEDPKLAPAVTITKALLRKKRGSQDEAFSILKSYVTQHDAFPKAEVVRTKNSPESIEEWIKSLNNNESHNLSLPPTASVA